MKISIAMATYNGARFLEEQLASLARQTCRPAELVACDDGSSDDTVAILERFSERAPFPVRIERNDHTLGISDNFLKAASLCRGEWIAFSDQDDVWNTDKLETVAQVVARMPSVMLVAHRALIVDQDLRSSGKLLHVPPVRRFTFNPRLSKTFWLYPYGFTQTFRAELIRDFPAATRPIVSFDRWTFVLANALGDTAFLPQSLALYRRHDQNASQFQPPRAIFNEVVNPRAAGQLQSATQLMRGLCDYLRERLGTNTTIDAQLLREAIAVYDKMAGLLDRRSEIFHGDRSRRQRAGAFSALLAAGAYGSPRGGGLGWRAALKDATRLAIPAVSAS